jgi:hypothetical protein
MAQTVIGPERQLQGAPLWSGRLTVEIPETMGWLPGEGEFAGYLESEGYGCGTGSGTGGNFRDLWFETAAPEIVEREAAEWLAALGAAQESWWFHWNSPEDLMEIHELAEPWRG